MSGAFALLAVALAAAPCLTPEDQTAGWKVVSLPPDMPALAAPPDVEQFRGGEPALVWTDDRQAYRGVTETRRGKRHHELRLPPGTRQVVIHFVEDLRGMKVDAHLLAGSRHLPLLDEKRIRGAMLELQWPWPDAHVLRVVTHHHARHPPVVGHVLYARSAVVADLPGTPAAFAERGVLYYLHPGGRHVALCERPGQALSVKARSLDGEAVRPLPMRTP